MTNGRQATRSFPVEEFLQALTAQLDRAQDALTVKVRAGRPLTWALKDLTLDLKVFVEVDPAGKVLMRSAAANEEGASTIHLNFTTITRPMVEENSTTVQEDPDPRGIDELRSGANYDEATQRKLEWMGIRTVGQLKQLSQQGDARRVAAMSGIPALNLQALLAASARPAITGSGILAHADGGPVLKIQGANLSDEAGAEVFLDGDAVEVLEYRPDHLIVRPREHHREGPVEVLVGGNRATGFFRLPQRLKAEREKNGGAA